MGQATETIMRRRIHAPQWNHPAVLVGCAVVAAIGNVEWSYRNFRLLLVSPPLHTPPAFGPCPPNDVFYVLLLLPRQQLHNSKCFVRPRIE